MSPVYICRQNNKSIQKYIPYVVVPFISLGQYLMTVDNQHFNPINQ